MINKINIAVLKEQIADLQEYIDTDICQMCEKIKFKLTALQNLIIQYSESDITEDI